MLRPNASEIHTSAEEWYDRSSSTVVTRSWGRVWVNGIPYEWLTPPIDVDAVADRLWGLSNLDPHECREVARRASALREAATTMHRLLGAVVEAYQRQDRNGVIAMLEEARLFELAQEGDSVSTDELAEQLLTVCGWGVFASLRRLPS